MDSSECLGADVAKLDRFRRRLSSALAAFAHGEHTAPPSRNSHEDLLTLALGIDVFDKCGRVGEVAGACETLQTFVFGRLLATLGKGIAF